MKSTHFYRLFTIWILLVFTTESFAACTLTAKCTGGNWNAAATWTPSGCGGITAPTNACIIIIPACATVVVNINSPEYVNMEIYVYGTLQFDNGQKINMCPGYVKVFPGGQLTGGTPGSKINICGTTVWNGGTTSSGPLEFGGGTTLPVELLSFNAIYNNGKVDLTWETASETNNDYFSIEKSLDGASFQLVSTVDGAGTSSSFISYTDVDHQPYEGLSYYRLKQTDFNGDAHYSALIPVNYIISENGFELYPNPATNNSTLYINLHIPENKEILVVVRDIQGREFYSKVIITSQDNELVAIDPENNIAAGTYVVIATSENKIFSRRLIIQ
ncbi:MAG: T9SS type A sorting domain-containing protein [Bacteroidota bacterium]|nr:T9SS type A sorting domain-containing protein [Bacteroidota bacterium]